MRLLSLCNEHTAARGFTIDDIAKWPVFKQRNTPRKTIARYLDRFVDMQIAESPGLDARRRRLFRIKNREWANAYIEGDKNKPWITPNPYPPSESFLDHDDHRDHFDVIVPPDVVERVLGYCETNNGQRTMRTKGFTLSFNERSRRGQLFVKAYWRTEVKKWLGDEFYEALEAQERKGAMRGDFCLPVDVKGQRFTIGGRPTQFSASHYPAQLDIRASRGDDHIREGLLALTNQADFNTRMLDHMDATLEVLKAQGKAIDRLVKMLMPDEQQQYHAQEVEKGDYTYG